MIKMNTTAQRSGCIALLLALLARPALAQFTPVRLQPPGINLPTFVTGVEGNLRVGYEFTFPSHGFLWTGNDPAPQDFGASSTIYAINGGRLGGSLNGQACFWNGSAAVRTDLGPSGS